jgi:hypothetical protein
VTKDPSCGFAIGNDEQYKPVRVVANQGIRVGDGNGAGLLAYHSSRPLDAPRAGADRLVVVVHGAVRDSRNYLRYAQDAARRAGSGALIVAPQFLADVDVGDAAGGQDGMLRWDVEGWKGGYPAPGPVALSSFSAMDSLLNQLAWPDNRPTVVIFGNSAGGQYVNRYAAVGHGPDLLADRGVRVRFVIANPSTYLYFDRERPVPVADGASVNRWRYGLDEAPPYVDSAPEQALARYLARDVTIALGQEDTDNAALLLEVSPPAVAQGANRFERGMRYDEHVRRLAGAAGLAARHKLIQLAGIGHSARDVLAAAELRTTIFG